MYGGDEVSAIVVEIGQFNSRAGYAGEDTPKAVIPSAAGQVEMKQDPEFEEQDEEMLKNQGKKDLYYLDQKLIRRDFMNIQYPMEKGSYTDWDLVQEICYHLFYQKLSVDPKEHPFLCVQPTLTPKESRVKMAEIMFEKLQVPALFLGRSAVMQAFAVGRPTALVLDSGESSTYTVPVHDGYALMKTSLKFDIGGGILTDLLMNQIEKQVEIRPRYTFKKKIKNFMQYQEDPQIQQDFEVEFFDYPDTNLSYAHYCKREIVRDIKETHCKVSDQQFNEQAFINTPSVQYELPDGTMIEIGNERFQIPESLFVNQQGILGFNGVHQMIMDAVSKCDLDIRKELYNNIVVTGGNSLLSGFTERLQIKLNESAGQNVKIKLIAPALPVERRFSAWIGGSILSSLGSFQQMWISRQEYDEHGKGLIDKKCP